MEALEKRQSLKELELKGVHLDKGHFVFDPPVVLSLKSDSGYLESNFPALGMACISGRTEKELVRDFTEQMNMIWEGYIEVDEKILTRDALDLRYQTKSLGRLV